LGQGVVQRQGKGHEPALVGTSAEGSAALPASAIGWLNCREWVQRSTNCTGGARKLLREFIESQLQRQAPLE
jgi:hypothetical protein